MTELSELQPVRELPSTLVSVPTFITGTLEQLFSPEYEKARQGNDYRAWDIETVTGANSDGSLKTQTSSLEQCIWDDCYVNIDFNKQGLAVQKSGNQEYQSGKNIYFHYPRNNTVAEFYANSDRANLNCKWDPSFSSASLGVFASISANQISNKITSRGVS